MDAFVSSLEGAMRDLEAMEAALRSEPETCSLLESMAEGRRDTAGGRQALERLKALHRNAQHRTIDQTTGNNLRPEDMKSTILMEYFEESRLDTGSTITTARQEAPQKAHRIFDNFGRLEKIIGAYADLLSSRWMKRTVAKRKKLLLEAWPGMS